MKIYGTFQNAQTLGITFNSCQSFIYISIVHQQVFKCNMQVFKQKKEPVGCLIFLYYEDKFYL